VVEVAETEKSDTDDEDLPEESEGCGFEGDDCEDVSCVSGVERKVSEEADEDALKLNYALADKFGDSRIESVPILQESSDNVSD
jgi:hypothetical protein